MLDHIICIDVRTKCTNITLTDMNICYHGKLLVLPECRSFNVLTSAREALNYNTNADLNTSEKWLFRETISSFFLYHNISKTSDLILRFKKSKTEDLNIFIIRVQLGGMNSWSVIIAKLEYPRQKAKNNFLDNSKLLHYDFIVLMDIFPLWTK